MFGTTPDVGISAESGLGQASGTTFLLIGTIPVATPSPLWFHCSLKNQVLLLTCNNGGTNLIRHRNQNLPEKSVFLFTQCRGLKSDYY